MLARHQETSFYCQRKCNINNVKTTSPRHTKRASHAHNDEKSFLKLVQAINQKIEHDKQHLMN